MADPRSCGPVCRTVAWLAAPGWRGGRYGRRAPALADGRGGYLAQLLGFWELLDLLYGGCPCFVVAGAQGRAGDRHARRRGSVWRRLAGVVGQAAPASASGDP